MIEVTTEIASTAGGGLRENAGIAADRDEGKTDIEVASGHRGVSGQDSSSFSFCANAGTCIGDGGLDLEVARIGQVAQVRGEVARTDENSIYSFDGRNGFNLTHSGTRLHLHQYTNILVGLAVVIGNPAVAVGARSHRDTPVAERRVPGSRHGHFRFSCILNEWNQNGSGADIEDSLDQCRIVPDAPDHGLRGPPGHGLQLRKDIGHFVGSVLHIDENPIETRPRQDLGGDVTAKRAPQSDLMPALA